MIIGACSLELIIYESSSLKDKRHIIRSIIDRIKAKFNVSIAEIELNDSWQRAKIGFACVTNSSNHANQVVSNVIRYVDEDSRVEIIEQNIEIL